MRKKWGWEGGKPSQYVSDRGDRGLWYLLIWLSSLILCISVSATVCKAKSIGDVHRNRQNAANYLLRH
jgi:hypothetical protein